MIVYLNGAYLDCTRAVVSVDDRGFLFGDGVYEVTRARDGRLFAWGRHFRRLARGLEALGIALLPELEAGSLHEVSQRLLRENDLGDGDATVYLQITRGVAERTHHFPPSGTPPTVFLSATRLAVPDDLRACGATAISTEDLRWGRCDLKTINLLPNVLAKQRAVAAGALEAILVRDGIVTEGASSNAFAVIGGVIRTHPADRRILAGITREMALEVARELGLSLDQEPIVVGELAAASELFLTATTLDVMPVVTLDGRSVGTGEPGPIARKLHTALRARLTRETAGTPPVATAT